MYLWIQNTPAAPADIARAVDQARRFIEVQGLTLQHCARQARAHAEGDDYGQRGLAAWELAEALALELCHPLPPGPPAGARLALLNPPPDAR